MSDEEEAVFKGALAQYEVDRRLPDKEVQGVWVLQLDGAPTNSIVLVSSSPKHLYRPLKELIRRGVITYVTPECDAEEQLEKFEHDWSRYSLLTIAGHLHRAILDYHVDGEFESAIAFGSSTSEE